MNHAVGLRPASPRLRGRGRPRLALLVALVLSGAIAAHRTTAQAPPAETLTFNPVADGYVDGDMPTSNFDSDAVLKADATPARIAYLRFAVTGVSGRAVQHARLRLGVAPNSGAPSVVGGTIHRITDTAWNEATLTFNNRPALDGAGLQTLGAVALNEIVEFDLDTVVTADGLYSFALDSTSDDGVSYNSMAASSGQKPQLVLTVASAQSPTVTIVQPATAAGFFTGDPITFQGTANDPQDGDLGAQLQWTSNLDGPLGTGATISRTLRLGTHTITASVRDANLNTGSKQITVSVTAPPPANTTPLVSITAPINGTTVSGGTPIVFTGSANDLEDGNLTAALVWTSSLDGNLGTGGTFTRTLTPGTHVITAKATDTGLAMGSASATVTVTPPVTLTFTPTADAYVNGGAITTNAGTATILRVRSSTRCDAYLRFAVAGVGTRNVVHATLRMTVDGASGANSASGGSVHTLTNNAWTETGITFNNKPAIDGPTLATAGAVALNQVVDFDVTAAVTGDGTYNLGFLSASTDNVDYRSREAATGKPQLILTLAGNAPVVTVTTPPNQTVAQLGSSLTFTGTANDVEDGNLASQIRWTSSLDGVLGTGASVSTSTLRVGTHTITAAVTDSAGMAGQGQITVRVRTANVAPSVTVTAPPSGGVTTAGTPVTLAATAIDDFDGAISSGIRWSSNIAGPLGTGASITVSLGRGTHILVASATDSDGATGSSQVSLVVNPSPPTVSITAPAIGTAVFGGTSVTFTASATDATDGNIGSSVQWTSDRDGSIGTGASIATSTLSVGTHVVTASVTNSASLTATATRTVVVRPPNQAPTLTIDSPVSGAGLLTGNPILLAATATDAENGNLGAAVRWSSSLAGSLGTGAVVTVPTLALGTHVITATVTDLDGQTTTATSTITITSATLTFLPVADAYVNAGKTTTNFGTATELWADSSPVFQSFLRFQTSGIAPFQVKQAILRMTASANTLAKSAVGGKVNAITNHAWTESGVTYATRPTVDGPVLATRTTSVAAKAVVDFDVTTGVTTDGMLDLALTTTNADEVIYNSREATTGKPQLIVTLKQNTKPVVTITAPASGGNVQQGTAITFSGTATDAESGNLTASIQWTSDRDGAIGTGASFSKANLSPGPHVITAKVTDAGGLQGQASITVNIGHPPVVTISAPGANAVFFTSQLPISLVASATDQEDGNVSGLIKWASSLDGPLGSGAAVSAGSLQIGTHVLTASVTDTSGSAGQAQVTIRVRGANAGPTLVITAPANNASVAAGQTMTFTASATDDFDGNIASRIGWSSSLDGPLGTGASRTVALHEGTHVVTATVTDSDGVSASQQVTVRILPSPPAVTITAPAVGTKVFVGTPITFSGTALDATDGNLGASLRWVSSRDGQIGLGASFSTSSLTVGTHVVTASVTDASNLPGSAQRTVIVRPPNAAPRITIDAPLNGSGRLAGKPVLLSAMATDNEDGDLSAQVRWSSSLAGTLGTGAAVVVPSLAAGTHVLTATVTDADGASTTASVTVTLAPAQLTFPAIADTSVDGSAPTKNNGVATQLFADASPVKQTFLRFAVSGLGNFSVQQALLRLTADAATAASSASGGAMHVISDNTWSEATTTFANKPTIDGPPLATRGSVALNAVVDYDVTPGVLTDGTYNFALDTTNADDVIFKSREAAAGRPALILNLTQDTAPVVHITAPASGTSVNLGTAVTFTATATDAESGNLGSSITWSSSLNGPIGNGPSISVAALSPGTHTITARVQDSGGAVGQAQITFKVNHPPVVTITTPSNGRVFYVDELPVALGAVATDIEDGDVRAGIQWSSNLDGPLGNGPTLSTSGLRIGTHTLTAAVTDASNASGQATVTIRVRGPNVAPSLAITAPANGTSVLAGAPMTFTASAIDDFDGDISSTVAWSSSRDGALGTGATRTIVPSEGAHVITATVTDSNGASVSRTITVTILPSPPVVTITAPTTGTTLFAGTTVTFTGTALDATDGTLTGGLLWTSDADGLIGTGGTFTRKNLSVGTHVITAAATDSGNLIGIGQISVIVRPPNVAPSITINLPVANAKLVTGKTVLLNATATDPEDGDLSSLIQWTSDRDGSLGTGATRLLPTLSVGTHTITASVTDRDGAKTTATTTVVVSPAVLTFIAVADTYVDGSKPTTNSGTATTLWADGSPVKQLFLRFTPTGITGFGIQQAIVRLTADAQTLAASPSGGTLRTMTDNTWSEATTTFANKPAIDGPTVATRAAVAANAVVDLDVTSVVTADAPYNFGLASTNADEVIYKSREAASGKPQLIVTLKQKTPPAVTITAPANNTTIAIGQPVTFTGTASDAESGNLAGQLRWTSDLDGSLGTGASVAVAALRPGSHTITASVTDPDGMTGQAVIHLQVGYAPLVTITAPALQRIFFLDDLPVTFTGTAIDQEDGVLTNQLRWTSSRDGLLGTGATVTATLSVGTHVITAQVTDGNHNTGQKSITVRVRGPNQAPTIRITAPANNGSTPAGTTVTLTATASDDFDGDLSNEIIWTSSRDGSLGTGGSRTALLREGNHTITATVTDSDGVSTSTAIAFNVTPTAPVVIINLPAAGVIARFGASVSFAGTALDATDGDLSARLHWVSDRDGAIGDGATFSTTSLRAGVHHIIASVADTGNLVGQATLTLTVKRFPVVNILLPQANARYLRTTPITFFATADDAVDGDIGASLTWASDKDGALGTGPTITANLSVGTHVVTATATNSEGNQASAQVTFLVHVEALSFQAVADTYVDQALPTTLFGAGLELAAGQNLVRESYLRFNVAGMDGFPVASAGLVLTVGTTAVASGGEGGTLRLITNNTWSEAKTTFANKPAIDGPIVDTHPVAVAQREVVTFQTGSAVTRDGTYNFAITSASQDSMKYQSREVSTPETRPHLDVLLAQPELPVLPTVTIAAPANDSSFYDDDRITFSAHAQDSQQGNIDATITWRSNLDGPIGAGASITATLSRGVHTIFASARNGAGLGGTSVITVTITDRPPLVAITAPQNGRLFPIGFAINLTATATDTVDGDLAAGLRWSSDRDGIIGTGRSIVVSNLTPGDHTITAQVANSLGTIGRKTIVVFIGAAPPQIAIQAPAAGLTIDEGTPITLQATATDVEDGTLSSQIVWTSTIQGALGTGASVPVILTGIGTHVITASITDSNGFTRTAQVSVTVRLAPPVLTIVSPADGASATGPVTFAGTAIDFRDGNRSAQIKWTSSLDGLLGTGATLTKTLRQGIHTVTVQVTDSSNLTATKTLTVVVGNRPPTVTITAPAPATSARAGTPITFAGTATDAVDGTISANIVWTSDLNGQIGTGATFSTSTLARGHHVITARATDTAGISGVAQTIIDVTAAATVAGSAPTVAIVAPANNTQVAVGTAVTFTGTANDTIDGTIASTLTWTSDIDGLIGTGASFTTSTLSLGTHTITASVANSGGLIGSATTHVTTTSSSTSVYPAVADAYTTAAAASVDTNFGADTLLRLSNSPVQRIYLRFVVNSLPAGPIVKAVIRLNTTSAANAGTIDATEVHTTTTWDEATITHNNKPALDAPVISNTAGPLVPSQTVDLDVTSVVTGNGTYNFALKDLGADRSEFVSREGGAGGPQLLIFRDAGGGVPTTGQKPSVHITSPVNLAVLAPGTPVSLAATASDPQDGNVGASIVWRSDRDGVLGLGANLTANLTDGVHLITATATDTQSNTGADVVRIKLGTSGSQLKIDAPANNSTLAFGTQAAFIASATDPADGDISFQVAWSSNIDGSLGTGPSFLKALSLGVHTITATVTNSAHVTSTATITVTVSDSVLGYQDQSFGLNIENGLHKATSEKLEDKEWYVDGIWWASIFNLSKSQYEIHRLDEPTQKWVTTGIAIDERGKSRQDCLWDGTKLYVLSYNFLGTPPETRVYRYSYFSGGQRWSLDSGFPVAISGAGAESQTIAKDSTGRLWTAYQVNNQIWVNRTLGDDRTWGSPFVVPVPQGTVTISNDKAGVIAMGDKIGVWWDNQATDADYFAWHLDTDPPTNSPSVWHQEIANAVGGVADDHANMKYASDGRLFVAMKTGRTTPGSTLVGLLVREANGTWSSLYKVGVTDFKPTRPHLILDEVSRKIYYFHTGDQADVYVQTSSMDSIAFTGVGTLGTPIMKSGTHPDPLGTGGINNPTTTKQNVDPSWGLPVLAATTEFHTYWHAWFPRQTVPQVTIAAPADATKVATGTPVTFTGSALSLTDGIVTSSLKWVSSISGQIGTGGSFTVSTLPVGIHHVTATATDSKGLHGSATITLTVESDVGPVITVTQPGNGARFVVGSPVTFAGSAADSFDGDRTATMVWTSSRDGRIGTGAGFATSNLTLGTHTITVTATDTTNHTGTTSFQIEIRNAADPIVTMTSPANGAFFAFGAAVPCAATASDLFDGDVSANLHWTSSRDGGMGVGASFSRSTLSLGTHVVTAAVTDSAGRSGSASRTVTIVQDAPPIVTITAPANGAVLGSNRPLTFAATAQDQISGDVGASLVWTSNRDGQIGTGRTFQVSTLSVGSHTITALATDGSGLTATAQIAIEIRVQPAPTVTITTPANGATLLFANDVVFTGTANDTIDGTLSSSIRWTSSRDGLLGTGASLKTTLSLGTHTITASVVNSGNTSGSATITVDVASGPQIEITNPADHTVTVFGSVSTFDGIAFDFEDGDMTTRLRWSSSRDGTLGTGPSISAILSLGTHVITAETTDRDGHTGSATITVEVDAKPTITIFGPANASVYDLGASITFTGNATDAEDGNLTSTMKWSSSINGQFGTGGSVSVGTLTSGVHTISASATDSKGVTGARTRTIVVDNKPVVTITAPANGATVNQGAAAAFTATATDTEDGNLAGFIVWTSNVDGQLGSGGTLSTSGLSAGPHTITASVTDTLGRSDAKQVTVTVNAKPVVTLTSPALNSVVTAGTSITFAATALDAEEGNVANALVWTSSRDGHIGDGASFGTSALAAGTHLITATATDHAGAVGSAAETIRVNARPVVAISAPTTNATVTAGAPVAFTATATDAEDGNLAPTLVWASNIDGQIGTGPSFSTANLSTGVHVITAGVTDSDGVSANAMVTLTINAAPSVTITAPATGSTKTFGSAVTFTATATDLEDGNLAPSLVWTSSRDGEIGTGGSFTTSALTVGSHTITASVADAKGAVGTKQITLLVNQRPTVAISAPGNNSTHTVGVSFHFGASASDAEDGDVGASLQWSSDIDGPIGSGPSFNLATLGAGTHTITAVANDSKGATGVAQVIVRMNVRPTATITAPANNAVPVFGTPITFAGSGADAEDGSVTSSLIWTSSRDGQIGMGGSFSTTLSAGVHTIRATALDSAGATGSTTITVTVDRPPTASIATPANGSVVAAGTPVTFTATATDPEDGDIAASVVWTSDRDGVVGGGASFSTSTLSAGTHTITAVATDGPGLTATASLTLIVNAAPIVAITAPADHGMQAAGTAVTFAATATDAEDGDLAANLVWTSSLDGPIGTGASFDTSTLSAGTHTITAQVTDARGAAGAQTITFDVAE